jgi:predicted ester cyclase
MEPRASRVTRATPSEAAPDSDAAGGEANRRLIEDYVDRVWAQRDLDALVDLLDPAYRRHVSPIIEPLDATGQRQRLGAMQAAFPDVSLELREILVQGDLVAFRSIMRGTHQGAFRGLPPTGKPFEVHLVDIVRIGGGRLVEHWGGPDMLDLLTQLGATVEPGPID